MSRTEQMSIGARFYDKETSQTVEAFLKITNVENVTAAGISAVLLSNVAELI